VRSGRHEYRASAAPAGASADPQALQALIERVEALEAQVQQLQQRLTDVGA